MSVYVECINLNVHRYWATNFCRIIYGLGTSQLGDLTTQMTDLSGKTVTISQFLQDFFNYDFNFIWQSWVIVLSFTLFFRLGASLGLRYLNFNKR
jgi:hypothetical protein